MAPDHLGSFVPAVKFSPTISFSFFVVSGLGQPDWDYRPILDVPAESPYAVYDKLPYPQHVRGAKGE